MIICLIQYFEADFLWKVSLKIMNSDSNIPEKIQSCIEDITQMVILYEIYDMSFCEFINFILNDQERNMLIIILLI